MDKEAIFASVGKTGRLVVVQEAVHRGAVASDIAATVAEERSDSLRAPVVRVTGFNTPIPFNLALEKASVPQPADIIAGVRRVLGNAPSG
jgi:pyruvate dehydrogenase E1 component beta subunit